MQRIAKIAVIVIIAVATAHWWLPPAVKLTHLLAANFDLLRQSVS